MVNMDDELSMEDLYLGEEDELYGDLNIAAANEPHMACALLLDVSGSMNLNNAIDNLNEGIRLFKEKLMKDENAKKRVDVCIVSFSDKARVETDFVPIMEMPVLKMKAYNRTNMADGILKAIELVKNRTHMYQSLGTPCFKPWIFMITDGKSTSSEEEMNKAADKIRFEEEKGKYGKLSFWALGVSKYDSAELFKLTNRVIELKSVDFSSIFDWLSDSFVYISNSQVDDKLSVGPLPDDARKAKLDRAIDEDWL